MRGADALALAQRVPADGGLARRVPAGHARLDRAVSQLKQDPATRHIPVQIVTLDEDRQHGLARGAFSFVTKPTTTEGPRSGARRGSRTSSQPRRKRLLVVEDNPAEQLSIAELLGHDDIDIVDGRHRRGGARRAAQTSRSTASCSTCGCRTCPASRCSKRIRDDPALADVPVVVFTGRELSPEEDAQLHTMARSVVVKGVESPERLLDETALFLHRVVADLPAEKQRMLERLHSSDEDLVGKTVLVVDDDARNIFALSSVLERRGMKVLTATHRQRGDRRWSKRRRTSPSC